MLAKLELKITKGAGVTDAITGVTLDGVALGGEVAPIDIEDDLSDQSVRAGMISAGEQTGTMILGTALAGDAGTTTNDAIVVPQSVAGKTMTFTLASGGELVYTIPDGKTFESGKKHVYNVVLKLTGLEVNSTIEDWGDGGTTDGEATLPVPPAKIGDFYYKDGSYSTEDLHTDSNPIIGVVYAVTEEGTHGKVVSLKGYFGVWSTEEADTPATQNNGIDNTNAILNWDGYTAEKYPLFAYCAQLRADTGNDGWYIPGTDRVSYSEYSGLWQVWNADTEALDARLTAAGGEIISTRISPNYGGECCYFTSTQTVNNAGLVSWDTGKSSGTGQKGFINSARALLDF